MYAAPAVAVPGYLPGHTTHYAEVRCNFCVMHAVLHADCKSRCLCIGRSCSQYSSIQCIRKVIQQLGPCFVAAAVLSAAAVLPGIPKVVSRTCIHRPFAFSLIHRSVLTGMVPGLPALQDRASVSALHQTAAALQALHAAHAGCTVLPDAAIWQYLTYAVQVGCDSLASLWH